MESSVKTYRDKGGQEVERPSQKPISGSAVPQVQNRTLFPRKAESAF